MALNSYWITLKVWPQLLLLLFYNIQIGFFFAEPLHQIPTGYSIWHQIWRLIN
jgi:hypothetical protein